MVDTLRLEYLIKNSGHTYAECAERMGISLQGFLNKMRNRSEFKYSEVCILADMIGTDIRDSVFFKTEVELNRTDTVKEHAAEESQE